MLNIISYSSEYLKRKFPDINMKGNTKTPSTLSENVHIKYLLNINLNIMKLKVRKNTLNIVICIETRRVYKYLLALYKLLIKQFSKIPQEGNFLKSSPFCENVAGTKKAFLSI